MKITKGELDCSPPYDDPHMLAIRMLNSAGQQMMIGGSADRIQVFDEHDVHGFYELNSRDGALPKNLTLHVQAYPGLSTPEGMYFMARIMDSEKLRQIRALGGVSIGNEHDAVVARIETEARQPDRIPWTPSLLKDIIDRGLSELADNQPE